MGTSSGGCVSSAIFSQNVSACVGIENFNSSYGKFIVYPNPANNNITIEAEGVNKAVMTDVLGKVVMTMSITGPKTIISLNDFKCGIYTLKVYKDEELAGTHKIVKE